MREPYLKILRAMRDIHDKVGFYPTKSQLVDYITKCDIIKGFATNQTKFFDSLGNFGGYVRTLPGNKSDQLQLTKKGLEAIGK